MIRGPNTDLCLKLWESENVGMVFRDWCKKQPKKKTQHDDEEQERRNTPGDSSPGARRAGGPTTVTDGTLGRVIKEFPAEEKATQDQFRKYSRQTSPRLPLGLFYVIAGLLVLANTRRIPDNQITMNVHLRSTKYTYTQVLARKTLLKKGVMHPLTRLPPGSMNDCKEMMSEDEW